MQFTATKLQICQALALVVRTTEKRTTIPILANVKLAADDSSLGVTGTDLNVALSTQFVPVRIERPGSITLPAKRLLDYCSLLPDGDIKFSVGDNAWATITAGRSRTRIAGIAAESFPEIPPMPESSMDVPGAALLSLVNRTKLAISTEESRFTLNGALVCRDKGRLLMVATDGHRLAHAFVPMDGCGPKFLLPTNAIKILPAVISGTDTVKVAIDDNHIFFRCGDAVLAARKLVGNFPDYERVLPKDLPHEVTVPRALLASAVARVAQFADDRSHAIRLSFKDGACEVFATSVESGESEDAVTCNYSGAPLEIGFNASYIADFLGVVDSEHVTIYLRDGKSAGEFRVAGKDDYRYVLMPMRIN